MKRILTAGVLALSVLMFSSAKNFASAQPGIEVGISYQTFYDELSPHGRWMDYPEYGYVWLPDMGPEFQPYRTGGHWVWSDEYDWMWVSDYSWGWAPFHYGRWFYDSYYGWMWVPGYEWSPAWVSWRTGGDFYGWAPLRPGISISYGFGNYDPPYNYWSFAPCRYINSHRVGSYCVDRSRNVTIINNTTIINNYGSRKNVFISGGPRRFDAERYTGRIRSVEFRETNRPGGREFRNNEVRLYRPQIRRDNNRNTAPRKFDRYENNNSNSGNSMRRNDNNLPNRTFGNRTDANGQQGNSNRDIVNRRREVFNRNNNSSENREFNNPQAQQRETIERNRRNVFERNRNFERPNTPQQPDGSRRERRNIFNRNDNRPAQNDQREVRPFERKNRELQPNERRLERKEVAQGNNNSFPRHKERRETNNENRSQRQYSPQPDRQSQREFRGVENRRTQEGRREQRGDNKRGGRGVFDRRDR